MKYLGELPKTLEVNNKEWAIRSDFRVALTIFQALNDPELNEYEKRIVILDSIYEDFNLISPDDIEEALKQANWFIEGGKEYRETVQNHKKMLDWEQDEQLIFSAINKVANKEVRSCEYLHWWTFLGFFSEIGEGLFSTVVNIRNKKNKGQKLEKYEQEFYKDNKDLIDLKTKYTVEEQKEMDRLNSLFKK